MSKIRRTKTERYHYTSRIGATVEKQSNTDAGIVHMGTCGQSWSVEMDEETEEFRGC